MILEAMNFDQDEVTAVEYDSCVEKRFLKG